MRISTLVAAFALAAFPVAASADISVDPAHTSAVFSLRHLTISTVAGKIALKDAKIEAAPDGMLTSATANFDLATISTDETDRDNDLRSDHWFDVAKYPVMTFTSTKIEGTKDAMTVTGNLTFHGITRPVTLTAKYNGSITDNRGRTKIGYSASGTLDRTAWGLGPNFPPAVVGNDVAIQIELEGFQK